MFGTKGEPELSKEESIKLYLTTRFDNFLNIVEQKNVDNLSQPMIDRLLGEIKADPSLIESELNWLGYAVKVLDAEKIPIFYSGNYLMQLIDNKRSDFVTCREELIKEYANFVDDFIRGGGDVNDFPSDEFLLHKLSLKLGIEDSDKIPTILPVISEEKAKEFDQTFFTYFRG
jgi:hypothetical protein